jgi:uncharacterized protein YggT (Ycf19 family)
MVEDGVTEIKETTTVSNPQEIVKTISTTPPPVKTEHPQKAFDKKKTIFRTYQIVWYLLAVIEVMLGFRMALKALGANQASDFTSLIYAVTDPLALPFRGILPNTISGASILEWSTLTAAIVYALVAYGFIQIMQIVKPVTQKEVEQKVDDTA